MNLASQLDGTSIPTVQFPAHVANENLLIDFAAHAIVAAHAFNAAIQLLPMRASDTDCLIRFRYGTIA